MLRNHMLQSDLLLVSQPDSKTPFSSKKDVFRRLMPFHVLYGGLNPEVSKPGPVEEAKSLAEPVERARKRLKTTQELLLIENETDLLRNASELCFLENILLQQEKASSFLILPL